MLKILLADDENLELRYLKSVFEREGIKENFCVVACCTNGKQAVEAAEKYKPHIFITDIKMPYMDGIEASCKIKEKNPEIIVILNTAYAEFEFAKKALEYQFDAYLLKPTMADEIISTVRKCVEKKKSFFLLSENTREGKSIKAAKEYIRKNISTKLTLDDISEYVHFSPSYFSRMFKELEGMSLSQYINMERVSMAKKFIETTDMPIKDICRSCGFSSISNFNREYKKHTGMAPSQMRKE